MSKRGLALGVSLLALSATQGLAQSGGTPGPYVRLDGGWSHPVPMTSSSLPTVTSGSVKRDEGYFLGGAGGYKFGPWRGELELQYMENQTQSGNNLFAGATGRGATLRGSTSNLAAMVNGYYDIATPWPITPYIGVGIGADYFRFSQVNTTSLPANIQIANAFDTVFAYQAIGGVSYAINPQWSIDLEYRYFATLDPQVKYSPNPPLQRFSVNNASHNLILGVAWHFAPPPPPPVAAPPAPPPAAVAPQQQTFIVFFEFDKSSLTAEGRKVVDAAAAAFKSGKSSVAIAGYTDLAGTQKYNLALSKRRADTVKEALVRDGVPAAAISATWHGKENPRVPTADGVREPQNRRVEINM